MKTQTIKILTRSEQEIMKILWDLKRAFVNDIIQLMPDPKPAYNTTSTLIRILEKKGFVGHKAYGKAHQYYPIIKKDIYMTFFLDKFISEFFGKTPIKLVLYLLAKKMISRESLTELIYD